MGILNKNMNSNKENQISEPEYPKCESKGFNFIISRVIRIINQSDFNIIYCSNCGYVYNVSPKSFNALVEQV